VFFIGLCLLGGRRCVRRDPQFSGNGRAIAGKCAQLPAVLAPRASSKPRAPACSRVLPPVDATDPTALASWPTAARSRILVGAIRDLEARLAAPLGGDDSPAACDDDRPPWEEQNDDAPTVPPASHLGKVWPGTQAGPRGRTAQ
jgi:hypothetical protein